MTICMTRVKAGTETVTLSDLVIRGPCNQNLGDDSDKWGRGDDNNRGGRRY